MHSIAKLITVLVLLIAASLKAYQLATVPILGEGLLLQHLCVEFELLFSVFTIISFYKAVSGSVTVNPWYTIVLDLVIVGILIFSVPKPTHSNIWLSFFEFYSGVFGGELSVHGTA